MLNFFGKKKEWTLDKRPASWGDRPALYAFIEKGVAIPDAILSETTGGISWAKGAKDAIFSLHTSNEETSEHLDKVYKRFQAVIQNSSDSNVEKLLRVLNEVPAIEVIDDLISRMIDRADLSVDRLVSLLEWLMRNSPDIEPVKYAIALLGIFPTGLFHETFVKFAQEEEFSLFSLVAISHSCENPDNVVFELAQKLKGWGKIHAVDRLSQTTNPQIKMWLLTHGYDNNILPEYSALTCAKTGGLKAYLESDIPAAEKLKVAANLLRVIATASQTENGFAFFEDGEPVLKQFLDLAIRTSFSDFSLLVVAINVKSQAKDLDWTDSDTLVSQCDSIIADTNWNDQILSALKAAEDEDTFMSALSVALATKVDWWPFVYQRVENGQWGSFGYLYETRDRERFLDALKLSEKVIPLKEIATGPGLEFGLGEDWIWHLRLDLLLEGLTHFPGVGFTFIETALKSPVVRNRNGALRALSQWPLSDWPSNTIELLRQCAKVEPDKEVKQSIRELMAKKG